MISDMLNVRREKDDDMGKKKRRKRRESSHIDTERNHLEEMPNASK